MWMREKAPSIRFSKQEHPEDKSGRASDGQKPTPGMVIRQMTKEGVYQALKTPSCTLPAHAQAYLQASGGRRSDANMRLEKEKG